MITMTIISIVFSVLFGLLSIIPSLPDLPIELINTINEVLDIIFSNVGLLGFFFPIDTMKLFIPLIIFVVNFDKIYHFVMWIIKKIPFSID